MEFSSDQVVIIKAALRRGLVCAAYASLSDDEQIRDAAEIHRVRIESALGMIEEMEQQAAID